MCKNSNFKITGSLCLYFRMLDYALSAAFLKNDFMFLKISWDGWEDSNVGSLSKYSDLCLDD